MPLPHLLFRPVLVTLGVYMTTFIKFYLLLMVGCASLGAQASTLKETIKNLEVQLQKEEGQDQSLLLLTLAKAYYQDQDQEKAFETFLESLEKADVDDRPLDQDDETLYAEALGIYLDPHAQSTKETATAILKKYAAVVKEHPDYRQLAFLVGASYANGGQFSEFFDLFYHSYSAAPHHYLVYKTKAILHIKLFERASTQEAKDLQRQKILDDLTKAIEGYPQDHALYKMMVAFSPEKQKSKVLSSALKKIVDENIVVPRTDIGFYVEEAAKVQQFESAQLLLDKQREWYRYSRIINTAQEFLDQQRKRG